jgi:hypothetical protein
LLATVFLTGSIKILELLNKATAVMQRSACSVAKLVVYSRVLQQQQIVKLQARMLLGLGLRLQVDKLAVT